MPIFVTTHRSIFAHVASIVQVSIHRGEIRLLLLSVAIINKIYVAHGVDLMILWLVITISMHDTLVASRPAKDIIMIDGTIVLVKFELTGILLRVLGSVILRI